MSGQIFALADIKLTLLFRACCAPSTAGRQRRVGCSFTGATRQMTLGSHSSVHRARWRYPRWGTAAGVLDHPTTGIVWLLRRLAEQEEKVSGPERRCFPAPYSPASRPDGRHNPRRLRAESAPRLAISAEQRVSLPRHLKASKRSWPPNESAPHDEVRQMRVAIRREVAPLPRKSSCDRPLLLLRAKRRVGGFRGHASHSCRTSQMCSRRLTSVFDDEPPSCFHRDKPRQV